MVDIEEWREYDRTVDSLGYKALVTALKTEGRIRAFYQDKFDHSTFDLTEFVKFLKETNVETND